MPKPRGIYTPGSEARDIYYQDRSQYMIPDITQIDENNNINNARKINQLIDQYIQSFRYRGDISPITNLLKQTLKDVDYKKVIQTDIDTIIKAYIEIKSISRAYIHHDRESAENFNDILEDVRKRVQGQLNNPQIYEKMWPRETLTVMELPNNRETRAKVKQQDKVTYCKELLEHLFPGIKNAIGTVFVDEQQIQSLIYDLDLEKIKRIIHAIKDGNKIAVNNIYIPFTETSWGIKQYYITTEIINNLYRQIPMRYKTLQESTVNDEYISLIADDSHRENQSFSRKYNSSRNGEYVEIPSKSQSFSEIEEDQIGVLVSNIQKELKEKYNIEIPKEEIIIYIVHYGYESQGVKDKIVSQIFKDMCFTKLLQIYPKISKECKKRVKEIIKGHEIQEGDTIDTFIESVKMQYKNEIETELIEKHTIPYIHKINDNGVLFIFRCKYKKNEETGVWESHKEIIKQYRNVHDANINGKKITITFNTGETRIYNIQELETECSSEER